MLYLVIERFKEENAQAVYERYFDKGRMLPDGATYVDSWVTVDMRLCYQLVETEDESLLEEWMSHWSDLVEFTVRPVVPGADMIKVFEK